MTDPIPPAQRAAIEYLRRNGYLATVTELVKSLTAPFFWREPDQLPERQEQGGTICFVDTGERLLGVTAGHVHAAIVERLASGAATACQIGGHTFDPVRCLIEYDERQDLATYALSEIQIAAAGAHVHRPLTWPPAAPEGPAYIAGGWPWALTASRDTESDHFFLHFIAPCARSSATNLIIPINTATSVPWGATALPPGTNIGGMSGGPLFVAYERQQIAMLALAGIIYEYHQSMEVLYARPLSLIRADGTIRSELL